MRKKFHLKSDGDADDWLRAPICRIRSQRDEEGPLRTGAQGPVPQPALACRLARDAEGERGESQHANPAPLPHDDRGAARAGKTEGPAKDRSAETDREASGLREASLSFPRTRKSSSPPPVRGYDRGSEGPHRSPPPVVRATTPLALRPSWRRSNAAVCRHPSPFPHAYRSAYRLPGGRWIWVSSWSSR